jgi:hypothetical protein
MLAATLWIYAPVLGTPFFADDYLFLDQVRDRSLPAVLGAPDPIGNFFRPVGRQLWFWLVTHTFGESPAAFHALGLAAWLGILALFAAVATELAGARAALLGAGFLVLHYAGEVPVRWAAGSQDLLAVLGALAALWLHLRGRALLAGVALLVALLSKETVVFTPLIAVIAGAGRRTAGGDTAAEGAVAGARHGVMHAARDAWPLFAAAVIWALVWLARSPRALSPDTGVALGPGGALAALAHGLQVALGVEWRKGGAARIAFDPRLLVAIALVAAAVAYAFRRAGGGGRAARDGSRARHAIVAGAAWALLATVPIAAVASIWSAYYYLFAMAGVALALGAWLSGRGLAWSLAALTLLGAGSALGRSLDDFAVERSPWTGQSHINRFYVERAQREAAHYLESVQRLRLSFPPRSTVFFAGLKSSVAFQTADGPFLRWAYRDPTLHSYYLNQFSRERAGEGPVFLFYTSGDTLREAAPGTDTFGRIAYGLTLNDRLRSAREALEMLRALGPPVPGVSYFEAWLAWSIGDTASAKTLLERERIALQPGPSPQDAEARAALAAGDSASALRLARTAVATHGRDASAHALLADLMLIADPEGLEAAVETVAARALAPQDPYAWRRFGMLQLHRERHAEALVSFERYFELAGDAGRSDQEAQQWVAAIRRQLPGGDLPQEALRE